MVKKMEKKIYFCQNQKTGIKPGFYLNSLNVSNNWKFKFFLALARQAIASLCEAAAWQGR